MVSRRILGGTILIKNHSYSLNDSLRKYEWWGANSV